MKFLDVFNPIKKGSHGLTDEAIYRSLEENHNIVPLYGGNSQHRLTDRFTSINTRTVDGTFAEIFSGEGIIISLDGSAGSMTYKSGEEFALNHHAGFITLNDIGKKMVNLQYFSLFMQSHYKGLAVSDGSKTLSLTQIYSNDFSLPEKKIQDRIIKSMKALLWKKDLLVSANSKIICLLNKKLSTIYHKYQARCVIVNKCIDYISGNSGLTEEFLYNNIELRGKRYKILSSATLEENMLGEVPLCKIEGRDLKVFPEKIEGLLVIRKGKAGKTIYLEPGLYTLNDDAYILYVKKTCPYRIHLKWLSIQYREEFLSFASSADNGTWNMTGFFNNVSIDIPDYSEQLRIVQLYEKAEKMQSKINEINNRLTMLLNKEIC